MSKQDRDCDGNKPTLNATFHFFIVSEFGKTGCSNVMTVAKGGQLLIWGFKLVLSIWLTKTFSSMRVQAS
jgi:hypothetical protein